MTSFGSGSVVIIPNPASPQVTAPQLGPVIVVPVPGPIGALDVPIDEYGRYIVDGGPPANGTGA